MGSDNIKVQTTCRSAVANVTINTPLPTLTGLQVVDNQGLKKEKFRYGDNVFIELGATGLTEYNYITIRVTNPDWKEVKEYSMHECVITHNFSAPDGKESQVFKLEFSAEPGWLKDQSKYKSTTTVEAFLCGSNYLPLTFHSWQQMRNDVDYDNPISELKVEDIEISKIIVFLDPGHGFMKKEPPIKGGYNTGGAISKYKYIDEEKNSHIIKIHQLKPEYIGKLTYIEKSGETDDKTYEYWGEAVWVYHIAQKMKENLLNLGGYIDVLLSRDKATDDTIHETAATKQKYRCDPANAANADYFISLHSDGLTDAKPAGGCAIYSENANHKEKSANSKELAKDIMSQYPIKFPNGVTIKYKENGKPESFTYVKDITIKLRKIYAGDIYVLYYHTLKAPYRVLVEMAFHSNPEEVLVLASEEGQKTLAQKLTDGLLINIKKHFTIK